MAKVILMDTESEKTMGGINMAVVNTSGAREHVIDM